MAITPDGAKLYVANYTSDTVTPISTATDTAGTTIPVADPAAIAVSPNGTMAYATNYAAGTVTPITVATGATGTPITGAGTQPYQLAFTPNGASGYVAGAWTPGTLTPFNLGTGIAGSAITVGNQASGVAITPDQAPVASFTATPGLAGSPTTFNASASTVTYGTIARYVWEFGDGATAVTTAPTVAHTYAAAGVYTSRVTETSSGGTSTTRVFTGKTVSRNGGPGASGDAHRRREQAVRASPPPDDEDPGPDGLPVEAGGDREEADHDDAPRPRPRPASLREAHRPVQGHADAVHEASARECEAARAGGGASASAS